MQYVKENKPGMVLGHKAKKSNKFASGADGLLTADIKLNKSHRAGLAISQRNSITNREQLIRAKPEAATDSHQ